MLSFSISYPDLIKFPYFADTTEREGIGGETEGDFTDNSIIYLSHASQKSGLNPTNRQTGWFV
jgi:hypothetical protein